MDDEASTSGDDRELTDENVYVQELKRVSAIISYEQANNSVNIAGF